MNSKKTIIYLIFFILLVVGLITYTKTIPKTQEYTQQSPADVVRLYFTAWSNKNYADMYSTISDGFKMIEQTAKDLKSFKQYAESQGIDSIKILNIKEKSNEGNSAIVEYSVEFTLKDGTKNEFKGEFTLKNRRSDIIRGWKLIHPYGENIDE